MMQKCTNENAARFPPVLCTVVSQKDIDFFRFSGALVDLSEPDSYEDQKDRIEPICKLFGEKGGHQKSSQTVRWATFWPTTVPGHL